MPRLPLIFPFAGRRDDSAHSEQPQLTTREARNVRGRDPITGRVRGAQRSGMSKFNPVAIGVGRIKALCSSAIDDRKVAYSFSAGAESTLWSTATPSKTDCLAGRVDAQGNVYALDGPAGIVKHNSAGKLVMKIALPATDPGHIVRALWVDEAGRVFAGVSAGGDVLKANVWCVLQLQDDQYTILWTLTPGAYTEDLRVYRGSQLYAAHNYPLENRARVLIYESIGLDPTEAKRIETVAYPINAMDVGADGAVYCSSPQTRGPFDTTLRPGFPGAAGSIHPPIEGWTPWDLVDARKRIWTWYDARDIDATDVEQITNESLLEDGQQVLRWRDRTANGRNWYAGSLILSSPEAGPTYAKHGPGGVPAVRFQNDASHQQSLVTLPNSSIEKALADQQRTAIPQYTGAMWAMFILMRPTQDSGGGGAPRLVFFADNQAAGASDHSLWVNRSCGAATPGVFATGIGSYFATTDVAPDDGQCAAADQALDFDFANKDEATGCVLVTILWDGGIAPADNTKTRCIVRMNGQPIDRFEGLAFASLIQNSMGYATGIATAVANRMNGEICSMLVLDRKSRTDDVTEPKVLTHDFLETGSAPAVQTDNEMAQIEAYMLGTRGLLRLLPRQGTTNFRHFYAGGTDAFPGVPAPGVTGVSTAYTHIIQQRALVSKHDPQGVLRWVCSNWTHPDIGTATLPGGIGYGVRARTIESDGKTHVWMTGPPNSDLGPGDVAGDTDARKVIDLGSSFSGLSADGAWHHQFAGGADFGYAYPKIDADKFGNLFMPGYIAGGGTMRTLHILEKDGVAGAAVQLTEVLLSADLANAVALPPDSLMPDYRTDLAVKVADVVYIFTVAASIGLPTVWKERIVSIAAIASGSTRSVHTIAVVEDDIRKITDSTNVIPSGGSAAIDATAQYVQALRAGDDIVVIDGVHYLAYSLRDGTIAALESTSAGEIPPRGKLAMYWRHRLVIGCFADAHGNYAASRLGNIRDWNRTPGSLPTGEQIHTSTQAFSGTTTRAGEAEDSLVAMIPVWDDLAFLVCESKILRLTGDPQDGGNIHKVTDQLGGVFGDSWCVDASGRVFMFGNKPPGLYLLQPEGEPVPLTARSLEQSEFAAIDFSTHRIMLAWNPIDRGVHIFQVAWGTSAIVSHWFYEEATHRLVRSPPVWQDRINDATKQPTAVTYLGGDDTRGLLLGCADGFVRSWDSAAVTDDGTPIKSRVMFAPVSPMQQGSDFRLKETTVVLAADQGGARVEIFASETADDPGPPVAGRDIGPGLNEGFRARAKGAHLHVRITSDDASRWAMEDASVVVVPAGRTVPRSP